MGTTLYRQSGSESLIDDWHQRILCTSYYCLRVLSITIANSIIAHCEQLGVVIPFHVAKHVFTSGGFNNNLNASSSTAKLTLHVTYIRIHFSSDTQYNDNLNNILNQAGMVFRAGNCRTSSFGSETSQSVVVYIAGMYNAAVCLILWRAHFAVEEEGLRYIIYCQSHLW